MRISSPGEAQFGELEWGLQNWLQRKRLRSVFVLFFFSFFLPTRAKIFLFIAINPWGLYGKLPAGITVSGDQRSREHPLAKFTVMLALINLVYLSLRWYLGSQHRSNAGQFPHCSQVSKLSLQAIQNLHSMDTFLTPSPGALLWVNMLLLPELCCLGMARRGRALGCFWCWLLARTLLSQPRWLLQPLVTPAWSCSAEPQDSACSQHRLQPLATPAGL